MKRIGVFVLAGILGVSAFAGATSFDERGAWFREARFGMFIHWGIYSIPGRGEWSYANDRYAPGEYEANAKRFNPVNYKPREWARLAKAAGMKYAVLTSRHHDGFCMFDSHFTDYKVTRTPYGKDAVREFLEAFRAEGLKVGLYHSLPDWTHPGYSDTESPECIAWGKKEPHVPTAEQYDSFTNLVYNHINQLTTEYGKLDLLFLDYTSQTKANVDYFGRDRLLGMIYRNQPDIIVNDRLSYYKDNCRDFDYYTPEICVPNQPQKVKGREVMWETCATMNDHWGYCREDANWKTPEAVIAGLVGCVSRNGNLLLNVGPTELGEIPDGSLRILNALADWYKTNGEAITGCGRSSYAPPYGCAFTQKGNAIYCHFLQSPLGDTILPRLKGKIRKATLLRTGETVEQVNRWGRELLLTDEQRIRTRGIRPGDVVRLELDESVKEEGPAVGVCRKSTVVPGEAPSLLPAGKRLELVWHDEFNGTVLDASKWSYRTNFWGRPAPWFATPEDNAVEVADGVARLKIVERNGQLKSPQLQTGSLLWDIPQKRNGIWLFPQRERGRFLKRYGYFVRDKSAWHLW